MLPPTNPLSQKTALTQKIFFESAIEGARKQSGVISNQLLPRLFGGLMPLLLFVGLFGLLFGAIYLAVDPQWLNIKVEGNNQKWMIMSGAIAIGICFVLMIILYGIASKIAGKAWGTLQQHMTNAKYASQHWMKMSKVELAERKKEFQIKHSASSKQLNQSLAEYDANHKQKMDAIETKREVGMKAANENHPVFITQLTTQHDQNHPNNQTTTQSTYCRTNNTV